jgi:hypothetical protein
MIVTISDVIFASYTESLLFRCTPSWEQTKARMQRAWERRWMHTTHVHIGLHESLPEGHSFSAIVGTEVVVLRKLQNHCLVIDTETPGAAYIPDIESNNITSFAASVRFGGDVNARVTSYRYTGSLLDTALQLRRPEIAAHLLSHPDIDVEDVDNMGRSLLHRHVSSGHVSVGTLLSAKANVFHLDNEGKSVLHVVARNGSLDSLHTLIAHGAEELVLQEDKAGALPSDFADHFGIRDHLRAAEQRMVPVVGARVLCYLPVNALVDIVLRYYHFRE